jgi:hypothetical protein
MSQAPTLGEPSGWCRREGLAALTLQMKISIDDREGLKDLSEWMKGTVGVHIEPVVRPAELNAQGSAWDFLSVLCESGGPAVAAVRALQLWIEARVTVVNLAIGEKKFTVRTQDAATILPEVVKALQALESGDTGHADRA